MILVRAALLFLVQKVTEKALYKTDNKLTNLSVIKEILTFVKIMTGVSEPGVGS